MFNIEEFDIKLDTEFIGRNFVYCEEVDSTNSQLMNNNEFDIDGTVLLAENQLSGKGRLNRTWESAKEQNLTFSTLLKSNFKKSNINTINLGASLSVALSIENLFQLKVDLKWPNDVLIRGMKVAGILMESTSKGKMIEKVVIGLGINVNQVNFKGHFLITPSSIRKEIGKQVSRERLLSEVLNNFEEILMLCNSEPDKVLADWKSRCSLIGEKVKIISDKKTKFGIFDDLDENGFLILKTENQIEKIHFGDVSLR